MKKGDKVRIKSWDELKGYMHDSPTVIYSMRDWCDQEVKLVELTSQFSYKQVWLCSNNYYYREEWFQNPLRDNFLTDDLFEI